MSKKFVGLSLVLMWNSARRTATKSILVAPRIALIWPVVMSSAQNVGSTQQPTHLSTFGKISSIAVMISALFQGIYGIA